jgi:nitrous oxidase accessory protein NosD
LNGKGNEVTSNLVAGVFVSDDGAMEVTEWTFQGNVIGISVNGKVTIENSLFSLNVDCGAQATDGSLTITDSEFSREKVGLVVSISSNVVVTKTEFKDNETHIEASAGGSVTVTECTLSASTGPCGTHVAAAKAVFERCTFTDAKNVAIFSEGDLSIDDSQILKAGRAGVIFAAGATGTIKSSTFTQNGDVAVQVQSGAPTLQENTINPHKKFGIFICRDGQPIGYDNKFEQPNPLANIWHSYAEPQEEPH